MFLVLAILWGARLNLQRMANSFGKHLIRYEFPPHIFMFLTVEWIKVLLKLFSPLVTNYFAMLYEFYFLINTHFQGSLFQWYHWDRTHQRSRFSFQKNSAQASRVLGLSAWFTTSEVWGEFDLEIFGGWENPRPYEQTDSVFQCFLVATQGFVTNMTFEEFTIFIYTFNVYVYTCYRDKAFFTVSTMSENKSKSFSRFPIFWVPA